jgi:hypothetical protein
MDITSSYFGLGWCGGVIGKVGYSGYIGVWYKIT